MSEQEELCALCDHTMPGGRKLASTRCVRCNRPICAWHGYPKYELEIKPENFIGRICYVCLSELSINPDRQLESETIMSEEKAPYVLAGQQLHQVTERRVVAPGQSALLLDNGHLTIMDSNTGAQFTLDAYAVYDLLDMLYNHKDELHKFSHPEEQSGQ